MNDEMSNYLDKLLNVYEEKIKQFRLSLSLLVVGTLVFFLLIFFPYMTLLGNERDSLSGQHLSCQVSQHKVQVKERFSQFATTLGNIPVSTAEVTMFFPVGVAYGVVLVVAQLKDLVRLRGVITHQSQAISSPVDIDVIAPMIINSRQSLIDRFSSGMVLLLPIVILFFSIQLIFTSHRLDTLMKEIPYHQTKGFYYLIHSLSTLSGIFGLLQLAFVFLRNESLNKKRRDRPIL